MKESYKKPAIELVQFMTLDVITGSPTTDWDQDGAVD